MGRSKFSLFLLVCFGCLLSVPTLPRAQTIQRAPWYETSVDSTSIELGFQTTSAQTATVSYGTTNQFELGTMSAGASSMHSVVLSGLKPSTTYELQIRSGTDTVTFYSSTASDHHSSGEIDVYFNRSIDSSYRSRYRLALGNQDFLGLLHEKILQAQRSIDLAVYSFGGATGDSVAAWLIGAKARGILVRFIADSASTKNSASYHSLLAAGIPAILNSFGNNGKVASNIHHNKFIVIDGRSGDGVNTWVLTGSWNLTDQQTTTDYQNIIHLQDLSIARQFEREFNEEWGSDQDQPDARYARFSTNKHDTTARTFKIGGKTVHLFFSPNGGAFSGVNQILMSAKSQVMFALLVFTRQDLSATLIADHATGVQVHGIINNTDKYEQGDTLRKAGLDVLNFNQPGNVLLHHKYAIVDPGSATATVITGSYNWSLSAEIANNENLLTVQSDSISIFYFQEWLKRYHENGGIQQVALPSNEVATASQFISTASIYPNPATSFVTIEWIETRAGRTRVTISDLTGRRVFDQSSYAPSGRASMTANTWNRSGLFTVVIEHDGVKDVKKLIIQP